MRRQSSQFPNLKSGKKLEMNPSREAIIGFDDLFDRLPDEIILSIFNKLHDAKSLCLSMSVCRRFHSIVPKVDEVFLSIPRKRGSRVVAKDYEEISSKNSFKNVVVRALMSFKPIRFISRVMKFSSRNEESDSAHYVPNDALKPFDEMRALHLRLPCHGFQKLGSRNGENRGNSTTFLKWKADFGSHLQSCVIVGAKSCLEKCENHDDQDKSGETEHEPREMTEAQLKLRIVWALSCLIAASARHFLIQETVKGRKMIENVVVSDESEQGMICMNKEQIEEMKDLKGQGKGRILTNCRSLRMKIWYAEKMELPGCGKVMEGATLVVIRPDSVGEESWRRRSNADLVAAVFGGAGEEKVVGEFARKLVLIKRCVTLEMNAF